MADVVIKPYDPKYLNEICRMILHIQREEFAVPITLEEQPDLLNIPGFYQKGNGNFWIALYENKVIGTIALIDIGKGQITLRKMFVDERYRGGEYKTGQRLLDVALAWMRERNCTQVFLGTIDRFQAAIKFYLRNGFVELPEHSLPSTFPKMKRDNRFFMKDLDPVSDLEILDYKEEHQPWFEKFNRDWIEKYFWMEPVDVQVLQNPDEHIIRKGGSIFMASCGKELAGTVALKFVDAGVYEFTKMAVEEKFRGKKVGKALAIAAIEKAKNIGAKKIILYSNTILKPAIELYRKLGFKEIPLDGPYKRSNIKMELILGNGKD